MLGQMQDQPLLISTLIDFASRHHREAEIVSRRVELLCVPLRLMRRKVMVVREHPHPNPLPPAGEGAEHCTPTLPLAGGRG